MLSSAFRPWGEVDWLTSKLDQNNWSLIACLGSEDRCTEAALLIDRQFNLDISTFIQIDDLGQDYKEELDRKTEANLQHIKLNFASKYELRRRDLLASPLLIKRCVEEFLDQANENVFLDISCFPKRYFFLILKLLLRDERISNLVVLYSIPDKYYEGDLAENPKPWNRLPTFQRCSREEEEIEKAIVGLGFLPFGLPELLKNDYSGAELSLLFPFPPGPPNYQRTWEFAHDIEKFYPIDDGNRIIRVDVLDVSGCFDHLEALTNNGSIPAVLAPYGPKTHSLAIALFAIKYDCDVFYTQPTQYHPDYSIGLKKVNGIPQIYSYCLKLNGEKLY